MPITDIILANLIVKAPLCPFIVKLVNTVSIVSNQGVDVVLSVYSYAHYLLGGVDFF